MQPPTVPDPVFLNVEYLFQQLYNFVGGFFSYLFSIKFIADFYVFMSILLIFLITVTIYLLVRLYEMTAPEKQIMPALTGTGTESGVVTVPLAHERRNEIWEGVRAKMLSDNPSDWRLAIIEADIYLDRILDGKGFHGETIGDKLKQVGPGVLASVQIAWEAHKVRNRIAHEGAMFELTQPEARRVLSYYEIVFRDLGVIE
jgi:hypothetical protein